jgi:5'-methylthioadenosine phosphorylase
MVKRKIGIIAGTALSRLDGFKAVTEQTLDTVHWGKVWMQEGYIGQKEAVLVPRHGRYHQDLPSETNFIGNLVALKLCGVTDVIAVSAVGSLLKRIEPGVLVFPDVTTDATHGRKNTVFGNGVAGHVARETAVCAWLHQALVTAADDLKVRFRPTGNLVVINGPHFSSRKESQIHRMHGQHLIGMNSEPEAKLARELLLHFAIIAQVTDLDNPEDPEDGSGVNQRAVSSGAALVAPMASDVIREVVKDPFFSRDPECDCNKALNGAILTPKHHLDPDARKRLLRIFGGEDLPDAWFASQD